MRWGTATRWSNPEKFVVRDVGGGPARPVQVDEQKVTRFAPLHGVGYEW